MTVDIFTSKEAAVGYDDNISSEDSSEHLKDMVKWMRGGPLDDKYVTSFCKGVL